MVSDGEAISARAARRLGWGAGVGQSGSGAVAGWFRSHAARSWHGKRLINIYQMERVMKPIGVVIPYFRAPEALKTSLECLANQVGLSADVYVRDNSENNILFTRAVNEGLKKHCYTDEHDYVLVMNQDVFLRPHCLQRMLDVMEGAPGVGICTPISISEDGKVNWSGGADAYPWGRHLKTAMEALPAEPYESHWANGACALLRVEMVREIGLMDENMRFICTGSDCLDTCLQLRPPFEGHKPDELQGVT